MPQPHPPRQPHLEQAQAMARAQASLPGQRLSNLPRLYQVPVFALRELLESRAPGQKLGHLRQAELVKKADEMQAITEADVNNLYENYRYGPHLAFYLYVLPDNLPEIDLSELQTALEQAIAQQHRCSPGQVCACRDFECESCPHEITLLDDELLGSIHEIRYRYHVAHRFLNADEHPDQVLQSRYGFLWLALSEGYLAILARDEQVNGILIRALTYCLRAVPQPVRFSKELLDKHFSIERAKYLSYYDPGTGTRRSISGQGLWLKFEQEIAAREHQFDRPASLYDEEVGQGFFSGVGIMAGKGKIYLTRALPTSVVRTWARQRLPELMHDVKELHAYHAQALGHPVEAVQRLRLPPSGRAAVNVITRALLQAEREDLSTVRLPLSALEIYRALAGKYFDPYLRTLCGHCGQSAELCPYCEQRDLEIDPEVVSCADCGACISDAGMVTLRCMNGHSTTVALEEAWGIAPNHWLLKRIERMFAEIGTAWDEREDYFHVEGNTLYRLRKARAERGQLPPLVQNYISNFWDPVTGQVHAGSGDIVTAGGNGHGAGLGRTASHSGADGRGKGPRPATEREQVASMLKRYDIRPTVTYTPTFHGPIYGPAHAGRGDIRVGSLRYGMAASDINSLFATLSGQVEQQAPPEQKEEALQQVAELQEAVQADKPDVTRMEAVVNWFKRNLPQLAGAVVSVVVHPIVGRLVEAAGDIAVEELRRRFAQ